MNRRQMPAIFFQRWPVCFLSSNGLIQFHLLMHQRTAQLTQLNFPPNALVERFVQKKCIHRQPLLLRIMYT